MKKKKTNTKKENSLVTFLAIFQKERKQKKQKR